MAAMASGINSSPPKEMTKKKEIYRYTAPWVVYGMNWSVRPSQKFRLAIGSFIEDSGSTDSPRL
jgi:WD repeat-containing protein 68